MLGRVPVHTRKTGRAHDPLLRRKVEFEIPGQKVEDEVDRAGAGSGGGGSLNRVNQLDDVLVLLIDLGISNAVFSTPDQQNHPLLTEEPLFPPAALLGV
jgi:hypothetical protein